MRLATLIGLFIAVLAAVFSVANIAGNLIILFICAAIILVAIGVLTGK